MAENIDKVTVRVVRALPKPLDKPMHHYVFSTATEYKHIEMIVQAVNELIDRQNAIIEYLENDICT